MHSPQRSTDRRITAARAFARSLNILLKCVRLYGEDHRLTNAQFTTAWAELRAALPPDPEAGFLLGVSGQKLLVDGIPLESGPTERGFAQLLAAAGVASFYFTGKMSEGEFLRIVHAFAAGGTKPSAIAAELKKALPEKTSGVRVNEIRYVAQDANNENIATALTARALGAEADKVKDWLNDPQKLLQLIAAAQGSKQAGPGLGSGGTGAGPLQESDYEKVVRLLANIGGSGKSGEGAFPASTVQGEMSGVSVSAQAALQQVLTDLAAAGTEAGNNSDLLVKAAEQLAIRFALDQYARGEVRVNAVREMLDRMAKEIEGLRKVIGSHEEKMGKAGILAESHADILDRAFWAQVPEAGKRAVLLSDDSWCIPPRNVRSYVEELFERRDDVLIKSILLNYAKAVRSPDAEARRKAAMGLSDLAEIYGRAGQGLLKEAVRLSGEQLQAEPALELQSLVSAALVRLAQEAGTRPDFAALKQAMDCVQKFESARPSQALDVRRRIGVESRLRKFITDAAQAPQVSNELLELLKNNGRAAAEELSVLFSRSTRRQDSQRLLSMASVLGPEAIGRLRELLRARPANEAITTIGLLAHLDVTALVEWLPKRLPEWSRSQHDSVVRQIGGSGVPDRARLLITLLDQLDRAVVPEVIDEIGMSGDMSAGAHLLKLAEGDLPSNASAYLQVKSIEALARLRYLDALPLLRILLQARSLLGWKQPREIRIVAAQALAKLDPDFMNQYFPKSGLSREEVEVGFLDAQPETGWVRHRRYSRVVPDSTLNAIASTERGRYSLQIKTLSLGGGFGARDNRSQLGLEGVLDVQLPGLRHLRSQVWMREHDARNVSFEIVNIDLEERGKLRKLLAGQMQRLPAGVVTSTQTAARSAMQVS